MSEISVDLYLKGIPKVPVLEITWDDDTIEAWEPTSDDIEFLCDKLGIVYNELEEQGK